MPVYEFECNECGTTFDVRATLAEKVRGLDGCCPACGGRKTRQVFGNVMVLTKSGGRGAGCDPSSGCCPPRR